LRDRRGSTEGVLVAAKLALHDCEVVGELLLDVLDRLPLLCQQRVGALLGEGRGALLEQLVHGRQELALFELHGGEARGRLVALLLECLPLELELAAALPYRVVHSDRGPPLSVQLRYLRRVEDVM
jgi:hypothetical protein